MEWYCPSSISPRSSAVPINPTSLTDLTEQHKLAEEKQAKMPIFLRRLSMKLVPAARRFFVHSSNLRDPFSAA
jgi:hypothetical protein